MAAIQYDLVVVGAGAGLSIVEEGLERGLRCALVESGKIGGTCLTRGCIPSKILVVPADLVRQTERARKLGLEFRIDRIDWDLISRRVWSKIDKSLDMEKNLSDVENLTLYRGTGEFVGDSRMRVGLGDGTYTDEFSARQFVLATGSRSAVPPIRGLEEVGYVTSESFFGEKFPGKPWKSLVIVGGGIIAAEFAHIFSALGTKVTLLEMLPRLLTTEEPEVSSLVEGEFRKRMDVRLNAKAVAARRSSASPGDANGTRKIIVYEDAKTGKGGEVEAEEIFVAVGRRSNADLLHPELAGVRTDQRGWIVVDEYLETSRPGIWAIGDATGGFQFRHKANYDSDILVHNMFGTTVAVSSFGSAPPGSSVGHGGPKPGAKIPVDYSAVPWAIYTDPQVGHVGMTEKEALDAGREIYVAVNRYSDIAKGFAMGFEPGDDDDGFVKLVIDKSFRILGAHVVGPQAAVLVQPFVYLMNSGYTCPPPSAASGAGFRGAGDTGKEGKGSGVLSKHDLACPEAGSFMPIYRSMIIHPSLNELTAWAIGNLRPVNIKKS